VKEGSRVQLHFEMGDPQAPRGHAIVYAHGSSPGGPILATYCVVFPISFSIGKFLPPMLAAQMPLAGLGDMQALSAVPIPPMLEEVANLASLRQLAERRGDDLCDMGVVAAGDENQLMTFAAEAAAAYSQEYASYSERWPAVAEPSRSPAASTSELNVEDVLAQVLTDGDRLAELSRQVGMLRYAIEGNDLKLLAHTEQSMRRLATGLPEKYRADQLIEAALRPDAEGNRLIQLYLQRAYKLVEEDYAAIPPIEREIRELRGEP
jgi:hypothetical protein